MSEQQYGQEPSRTDAGYPAGFSAGSMLRAAREARGEPISDVAHALKLAPRQIEAMELDRLDLLPGPVFARGFLRNYASYLGIDAETMLAALSHDVVQQGVELVPVSNASGAMPDRNGEQRVLKPVMIMIWVLLLALGLGWYFDWFRVADTPPAVSSSGIGLLHDAPMSPELLAERSAVMESAREAVVENTAARSDVPALVELSREEAVAPPPVASAPMEQASAPEPVVAPLKLEEVAPATNAVVAEPLNTPEAALASAAPPPLAPLVTDALPVGLSRLVFKLEGESWIQVRDTDDVTLFSGVAAAGTTRTVQGKAPFSLVVGNAAKVVLEHDGKPVDLAPHTRSGGVARVKLEQLQR